jgi:maleate cis-trans isomerase
MDARAARLGRNEALFREVNERIERVSQTLQMTSETIAILCECASESCVERIEVLLPEYERIRRDAELFFVRSGHEEPDVEEVVETYDRYDVVRKHPGGPAELARELDPRDDG